MNNGLIDFIRREQCTKCEADIGRIVRYKGKPYFDDGLMLVLIGLKRCHCCGKVFYWNGEKVNLKMGVS